MFQMMRVVWVQFLFHMDACHSDREALFVGQWLDHESICLHVQFLLLLESAEQRPCQDLRVEADTADIRVLINAEKLRQLRTFVAKFGLEMPKINPGNAESALRQLLQAAAGTNAENVVKTMAIRSMAKAG